MIRIYSGLILVLALTACREQEVTGTYLFQSERDVLFFDLVVSSDRHVSGQMKRVSMDDEGEIPVNQWCASFCERKPKYVSIR
jgi:hypothetical protein